MKPKLGILLLVLLFAGYSAYPPATDTVLAARRPAAPQGDARQDAIALAQSAIVRASGDKRLTEFLTWRTRADIDCTNLRSPARGGSPALPPLPKASAFRADV